MQTHIFSCKGRTKSSQQPSLCGFCVRDLHKLVIVASGTFLSAFCRHIAGPVTKVRDLIYPGI